MVEAPQEAVALLSPLAAALQHSGAQRLLARPGAVLVESAELGWRPLELAWDAAAHHRVWRGLQRPQTLADGLVLSACGTGLQLMAPPAPLSLRALVAGSWLSPLCARLLEAALQQGRNLLILGPWAAAVQLTVALVGEAEHVALMAGPEQAAPAGWWHVQRLRQARQCGAKRLAAWSLSPQNLVRALCASDGMVGCLPGTRLDRALMRYELASGAGQAAPLHVLSGLDLVAVVSPQGRPHLTQVAEVMLTEGGYRPQLLFACTHQVAPEALVPVGLPSFAEALQQGGHAPLVEELRHAVQGSAAAPDPAADAPSPRTTPLALASRPLLPTPPPRAAAPVAPRLFAEATALPGDEFDPGWELDRMQAHAASQQEGAVAELPDVPQGDDDAQMAATHGLAPPPRPSARPAQTPPPAAVPSASGSAVQAPPDAGDDPA